MNYLRSIWIEVNNNEEQRKRIRILESIIKDLAEKRSTVNEKIKEIESKIKDYYEGIKDELERYHSL